MKTPEIAFPTADGIAQAHAVAQRWLPAFLEGRRADDELYLDVDGVSEVVTWHNTTEKESVIQRTPSRTRANDAGARLEVVEVKVTVFDGGWVFQGITVGTNDAGGAVRIPVCLVARLVDGRIARFEEYADSRAFETLFSAPGPAAQPGG
jgi:ketosteroid isomerase-like protein